MKLRWEIIAALALGSTGMPLLAAQSPQAGRDVKAPAPRDAALAPSEVDPEAPDEATSAAQPKLVIVRAAAPQPSIMAFPKGASLLRGEKPLATVGRGTVLRQGDVLQNGPAGNLDVRLGDLGTLRLEPGSRLRLTTLLKQSPGKPEARETWVRLEVGSLLARLRGAPCSSRFVLDTPTAVITGSGAALSARVSKAGTALLAAEGGVDVYAPSAPGYLLTVNAQERVQIQRRAPDAADPTDEGDQPRLDALRQLAEAVDLETEPALAAIDAQIAAGKLLEAERQADYVIGRAWGRVNAVRAHARYLDSVRRRLGGVHLAGFELLGFDQTALAWYRGLPDGAEKGLQAALDQAFRGDAAARRWTLVWAATLHAGSGPVDTMPDRIMQLSEAEGADAVVRTECMALAALAIQDRNEKGRTEEMLRQATVLLEMVQSDAECDQILRMKARARLLFWPESRAQRTPTERKLDVERLLKQAEAAPHGWGYYFTAGALQALGREAEAAPYVARFFNDPFVRAELDRHPGFALPWAEQMAISLRAKGEKHHAREIWRFLARRYQHNAQIVERASEELLSIGL
ncbi:MAG: FecR domain-containing protein [Actinomycetota bacterium]